MGIREGLGTSAKLVEVVPWSDVAIVGEVLVAEKSIGANFIFGIPRGGRLLGSTVRLAEGVSVGERLEAGACRWQRTAARCAEEQRWGGGGQRAQWELERAREEEKGTLASSRGSAWG
jgi:hypothetical protein